MKTIYSVIHYNSPFQWLMVFLLVLPMHLSAELILPAIPSNTNLAKRFEFSTEMAFRVKAGETYLPSGALIAYMDNEIRGAQTASMLFPPTGEMIYKILIFNDISSGDSIRFKYYDLFSEKVYDITEKIEFKADLVPDYTYPVILHAYCPTLPKVTCIAPENGAEKTERWPDFIWVPGVASRYDLYLWEDGYPVPSNPYYANLTVTSTKVYNLNYGKTYHWKIIARNDCSTSESDIRTFTVKQIPDLTVTKVIAPENIESGTPFLVDFLVKNLGPGNTYNSPWNDAVYLSTDDIFSGDDRMIKSVVNNGQPDRDSSYRQQVTVSAPLEFAGTYYLFVKTDCNNALTENSETNNVLKAEGPLFISLKPLPDILVKDIGAAVFTVIPGDSLLISWKVQNGGSVNASGGWTERVSLIPDKGVRILLEPPISYSNDLSAGATISRAKKYRIPEILRFSGNAKIEVELIPSAGLIEHESQKANNKALSSGSIQLVNILTLDIQTQELVENTTSPVRCILSRSGDISNALAATLTASPSGQVAIPSSLVIPAGISSCVFNLNAVNNQILDGSRMVRVASEATGYTSYFDSLLMLDDEKPTLTISLNKTGYTEGETATLTITRDLVTSQPLTVNLSTNKPVQWTFAGTVAIPSGQASAVTTVSITDDKIPELHGQAILSASSAGFISAQAAATIIDNDIPEVEFKILTDTVSESGGAYATWGSVRRKKGEDIIMVNLTANPVNELFFPATVTLPKGTAETRFNIGVVDNGEMDGFRKAVIQGSIYISSCGCGTSPGNGGTVKDSVVIADNDGPALTITVDPVSLLEGRTAAGKLTVSRNTSTDNPLIVTIKHNDPTEVSIQGTAILQTGQKSVQVPVNTLNDNINDGDQMVTIQALAPSFSPGICYLYVTDQNKADLSLRPIHLDKDSAVAGGSLVISGRMRNTGYLNAPAGVKIGLYLSADHYLGTEDQLLGNYETTAPLAMGDSVSWSKQVSLPTTTGQFNILAYANPGNTLSELVYSNNTSDPVSFRILPEYLATAIVDQEVYMPGSKVPVHGKAYKTGYLPAPGVNVDIYILTGGTRRELTARTNEQGEFQAEFVPLPNETGHYIVGACYPGQKLSLEQDAFDIPGLQRDPSGYIVWEMKLNQTLTGRIGIKNMSHLALHDLVVEPVSLPAGCLLSFDTIRVLAGTDTKQFSFILKATELSTSGDYDMVRLVVKSAEGITLAFEAYYYCQALQGQLKADPSSIITTITKGKTRLYELSLFNNGAGATGKVTIGLPDQTWMNLVTPDTLENILPGDTSTVVIRMTPGTDMPLNTPFSGSITANCVNGTGVVVPFRVEAVSEETGSLKVDVVDEYTYFTEAAPHVKNAHVVVRHPFSGKIIADGFTGTDGLFIVDSIPEGKYTLTVEADKHEGYRNTITIDPGRENPQKIYLSFQAITYTWEVVPTGVEDEYRIELIMKYEANVPVPVVVIEMPTEMPKLVNDETFPFLVTLTNKGLITALDVTLNFPTRDPEYEFVTAYTKMNLLAQQAIQIPVVMKRKAVTLKSASADENCHDVVYTIYGFECGKDKKWHQSSKGITFKGRVCEGTPGVIPNLPGWGTPGYWVPHLGGYTSPYYTPWSYNPTFDTSGAECDPCLTSLAFTLIGCIPGLGAFITNGAGILSCLLALADMDISVLDIADCGMTGLGMILDLSEIGCLYGLLRTAYDCYKDPPIFVKSASLTSLNTGPVGLMPPILKEYMQDLAYVFYASESLDSLAMEIMGDWDWKSKVHMEEFLFETDPFIRQHKPFSAEDIALLKHKMEGTDIREEEIMLFTSRWNSTLIAWNLGIYSPTPQYPVVIDKVKMHRYLTKLDSAQHYAFTRGYVNILDMYDKAYDASKEQIEANRSSVCAAVTIKISQKLVMTREAFEGTLTIYNGNKTTAMEEVKLNLEIRNDQGIVCNDLFQIETKALDILTGIDGTGTLGPEKKGSVTILFIPEKGAAPEVPKSYSFGGSFSYKDPFTGVTVTKPLFPVTLDVHPSPDLYLHYFMQRDILGDDPLTERVEPVIPAELAVMIQNNGYGPATKVRIESAQPEIIENEKGLAIHFALIGSNLNGKPVQLGLTNIEFGDIAPKSTAIGQWWFTSDLLGHFVSYEATVTHLDSRGNPDLSLVSGATLHELIRSVNVYTGVNDGINDFLVNEVQDAKETPDAIYLSGGGVLDVYPASGMFGIGSISAPAFEMEVMVTPLQPGWNYSKMADPGLGVYVITGVTREDGQEIPLRNVWQTHVTLPDGKEPVYENILHFLDVFQAYGPVKYKIRFSPRDKAIPQIVRIENIPDHVVTTPVSSATVVFNKAIDPASFNYLDMTLRCQGGANLMDPTVTITKTGETTFVVDLSSKTIQDGYYVLNIQANEIQDLNGVKGETGKQATWTQFAHIPAVEAFEGLPENNTGAPFDFIFVRFNMPVDAATVLPDRFTWTCSGNIVSGTVTITPVDLEGKLFRISGLKSFLSADGSYSLSVDMPGIISLEGKYGVLAQSVSWKIDTQAPTVSNIVLRKEGGYDAQHVTSVEVRFNEPVTGFGIPSIELWQDGLRQPLSQLTFTEINDSVYLFTQFRLLTYYEGNYTLKIKMDGISDRAGNKLSGWIEKKWLVNRMPPKAVSGLRIVPDLGFSATDAITCEKTVTVTMQVAQQGTTVRLFQNVAGTLTMLAEVAHVSTGTLSISVIFTTSGNFMLEAHCLDSLSNVAITSLPVFLDEVALTAVWKNVPSVTTTAHPDSLLLEFPARLLDDSLIPSNLSFTRNGQPLNTGNLTVSKLSDNLYTVRGMKLSGNSTGNYILMADLTKLRKYSSGKPGEMVVSCQWTLTRTNRAPVANAGTDQQVNENSPVILDGTASADPDGDVLTFRWTAPPGITLDNPSSSKPTFTAPEVTGNKTLIFILVVNDGQTDSPADSVQIHVKDISITQTINFTAGWNLFSLNNLPSDPDMKALFMPLIQNKILIKVQDETGKALEDYGIFGGWVNSIGNLQLTEGYKVKVTSVSQITESGTPVVLPFKIPLKTGWNIMGFPQFSEANAMQVVQPIINHGRLMKVQDETGKSIEDWGVFGGWQNNIGNFKPGKGYKIKVSAADTLTILESYSKSSAPPMSLDVPLHFKPITPGNGVDHMNINMVNLPASLFSPGDEIAVYDGKLCVGAMKFTVQSSQFTEIRNLGLPVSASDDDGLPGFSEGNRICLKWWKASSNEVFRIEPEIIKGSFTFLKHESLFADIGNSVITVLPDIYLPQSPDIEIYPNPTDGKVYIRSAHTSLKGYQIKVVNALGQQVMTAAADQDPMVIDLSGKVRGIYYIHLTNDTWSKTVKIILR